VTATRSVIDSVQVAEVEKYAPEQYKAAKDSLAAAMAEIEKQNAKFALTRKYNKAEVQLKSRAISPGRRPSRPLPTKPASRRKLKT